MSRRAAPALVVFVSLLGALPSAASAATAVVSDKISIFEQPRYQVNEIVGLLRAGEVVSLDRCTASGNWCRVLSNGQPTGWVLASFLVGSPAKVEATPLESLTLAPYDERKDLGHTHHELW